VSSTGNRSNPNHTRISGQPDNSAPAAGDDHQGGIGGKHQESRDHHKHNNPGQTGHKPQRHGGGEEKH
jgi:hypothetical protein